MPVPFPPKELPFPKPYPGCRARMELRRREHERLPPQAGPLREEQDVPPEVLAGVAVKVEKSGSELSLDVVDRDVSESDSDGEYAPDETFCASGKKSSMTQGSNQEKLTGKKRTADVFQEDSPVEAGENQEKIVEGDQDGGSSNKRFKPVNVRCEPKTIRDVVAKLNARQREKVKELGFGWLFDFNLDSLVSRELIVWLMDHLDPDTMVLDFGGKKLHITEHTVWCVLGLQRGDLDPPLSSNKLNLLSLRRKLGVPEGKQIEITFLVQKIQSGSTDKLTMQCIMMIVLAKLLACNSSLYISQSVWNMVQDIDNFGNMNWCKFTVDHLIYSAEKWKKKKPDGIKDTVHGCSAFLVMYYLDNLDCEQKMRCVEVPRAKFFGNGMIQKLMKADKLQGEDGLPTFGRLNLRNQMGTCYDKRAESSQHVTATHMPIPGTSDTDIVGVFPIPHNQIGDSASHKSLCPRINKRVKQQYRQLDVGQIEEPEKSREENNEDGPIGYDDVQQTLPSSEFVHQQTDGDIAVATQGTTPSLEASANFHGDQMVPGDVPLGENAVTGGSEDSYRPVPVHSVQGAVKGQEKDFMAGSSEPEILRTLDSLLPQIRASVASGARASELEQQVKELTEKLSNKEEELEVTRETLRGAQSTVANAREELEASQATIAKLRTALASKLLREAELNSEEQAAVAAINGLALHLSAKFVTLGSDPPSSDASRSCTSLAEAVKLLKDQVKRVVPVSRNLARRSVTFGAAALLCRGREKGVQALDDAVDADTRRFVRSQGPEFHALVDQVVQDVELHHGDVQAGWATPTPGTSS